MRTHRDRTTLSFWFPKLLAAGLPVPKTKILTMPPEAQRVVWASFDGREGSSEEEAAFAAFTNEIATAGDALGCPFFLRTGLTSGKHNWSQTCFVADRSKIRAHVCNIAEFSEIADILGLPWDEWAVREMLPTVTFGTCKFYGDMPIAREFRCFVDGPEVECVHPYWPADALADGGASADLDYVSLCANSDEARVRELASAAGKAVGGAWSIDVLDTVRGWFITDMAEAEKSYHWPDCPRACVRF